MEGWQLGSDPEIQVANVATNHLTTALMKYFCITGRWEEGINLFHKLREREPDVDLLLAQLYLEMGSHPLPLVVLICRRRSESSGSNVFIINC
jgi:Chs5-Arf1p-binding protein BUD7/BCH1